MFNVCIYELYVLLFLYIVTEALITCSLHVRGYTSWSAALLFMCDKIRFSRDEAKIHGW